VPHEEMNSLVEKKVKKLLKKQKKKGEEMQSIDKFAEMSISSGEANSMRSDSSHELDSE